MSKIACKMKNSFAIDTSGKLFTWGSTESGLIGNDAEGDLVRPNELELTHENNKYAAEKVYAGHFHAAVIANRDNSNEPVKHIKTAAPLFKKLHDWFEIFVKSVVNPKLFIRYMMRVSENTKETKFDEFEKLFLKSFYAYQQLNNKDIFKMEKAYQNVLKIEFGLAADKNEVDITNILSKLETAAIRSVKDIYNFAEICVSHFRQYPDDLPFFIRLVTHFKTVVTHDDVKNIFEYCYGNYISDSDSKKLVNLDQETLKKIMEVCNELKISEKNQKLEININKLIDTIMGEEKRTGIGLIFTFGVKEEGRLGIVEPNEDLKNETDDEIRIQRYPRIVKFPSTFTKILKASCGYAHTIVITYEHTVYTWGSGKYGCLGNSKSESAYIPQFIDYDFDNSKFTNITDISAGMYFSLALNNEGNLFSWGCGNNGRLGHDDENSVGSPKKIKSLLENNIKVMSITSGDTHSCIITTSKDLYSFGSGSYGKLGHGTYEDVKKPTRLESFANIKVDQVICGSYNTMALTTDDRLLAWGKNAHGMLGIPQNIDINILLPISIQFKPNEYNVTIKEIALGTMHSLYLLSNGSVYACGNASNGVLGIPNIYDKLPTPKIIPDYTFFISKSVDITLGTKFEYYTPEITLNLPKSKLATGLKQIVCSSMNTAFITNNGELYMCGENKLIYPENEKNKNIKITPKGNDTDQLKWSNKIFKIDIEKLNEKVTYIAISKDHALCVADNKAFSWGSAAYGKLGHIGLDQNEIVTMPKQIDKSIGSVKMVCVSDTHSMILTNNGEIYACGLNIYGKLGIGDITKYVNEKTDNQETINPIEPEPVLVKNIIFAHYIACSNNHSACIMKCDSNFRDAYMVYTWGSGFNGKLGHSNICDISEPKKVEELESYKALFLNIALGDEFTLALDKNYNLWGWGKNQFLGISNTSNIDYTSVPKMIMREKKFIYISTSSIYCMAVDENGCVYRWGKIVHEDKIENIKIDFSSPVKIEPVKYVSCGMNHYGAITDNNYVYTWGSNAFYKCGQMFKVNQNNIELETYEENPDSIEFFAFMFDKNSLSIKNDKDYPTETSNSDNKSDERHQVQTKLLDEKFKNLALLSEDNRYNIKFIDALTDYFDTLRNIEEVRLRELNFTENKIISVINKSNCMKNNSFVSEIPKIIAMNFQLYETFISILQMHPCYVVNLDDVLKNKRSFVELVRIIYGKNYINLNNRRVIQSLIGLWNGMLKKEENKLLNNEVERCEDLIIFDIYNVIFKIGGDNINVISELTAEIFILFIKEICVSEKTNYVYSGEDSDIISIFRDLREHKKDICIKVILKITQRINQLFIDKSEKIRGCYSYSVMWIYKRIIKLFKCDLNKNNFNFNFARIFNYFLFYPFVELLKKIIESYDENSCYEYILIVKKICEILPKNYIRIEYSQLYNLYINDTDKVEKTLFKKIVHPKSDILKQVYDILSCMMSGELLSKDTNGIYNFKNEQTKNSLIEMNLNCIKYTKDWQYDFTIITLKEMIKNIAEVGNETSIIPISIRDLMQLQDSFKDLLNSEYLLPKDDPLRFILSKICEIKLNDLDSNSNIKNFVLNVYLTPFNFLFHKKMRDIKPVLVKCENCLLPISSIFFKNKLKEVIDGEKWRCECSKDKDIDGTISKCPKCGRLVNKRKLTKRFFKGYVIKHNDVDILNFEDVLFNLRSLFKKEDIIKTVKKEIIEIKNQKENKEKYKLEKYEKFIHFVTENIGAGEEGNDYESKKNKFMNGIISKVEDNIKHRYKHSQYVLSIEDIINFVKTCRENANSNFTSFVEKNKEYVAKVSLGISNNIFRDFSTLYKTLNNERSKDEKQIAIKKYSVIQLMKEKVIDNIVFENQINEKLAQKSFLTLEKTEQGFNFKLIYLEKFRRFIICGTQNHEYVLEEGCFENERILEMRRSARNNPTFTESGIRFNIFYFIRLLNSIEE